MTTRAAERGINALETAATVMEAAIVVVVHVLLLDN
jgi:hypothetical protein